MKHCITNFLMVSVMPPLTHFTAIFHNSTFSTSFWHIFISSLAINTILRLTMTADWRLPQFLSPLPLPASHYVVDQRSTAWSTANIRSSFDTLGFLNRGFISVIIVSLVNPVSNDLRNSLWTRSWSYFVSAAGDFDKTINFLAVFCEPWVIDERCWHKSVVFRYTKDDGMHFIGIERVRFSVVSSTFRKYCIYYFFIWVVFISPFLYLLWRTYVRRLVFLPLFTSKTSHFKVFVKSTSFIVNTPRRL